MAGNARRKVIVERLELDIAPSPMPAAPAPMLCTVVGAAFDNPDWIFEAKFDGRLVLARFDGSELTLLSRNNKPQESHTGRGYPEEGHRCSISSGSADHVA